MQLITRAGSLALDQRLWLVHFLTWLHLLARVCWRTQIAVWVAALCALAAQTLLLGYDSWSFVGMFEKLPVFQTPALEFALLGIGRATSDNWLLRWNRQIVELAWLATLIGVWLYIRALNRAIPDGMGHVATHPTE